MKKRFFICFLLLGLMMLWIMSPKTKSKENHMTVHIKTQADLDNYLEKTGSNWSQDSVYFENTRPLSFPEDKVYHILAPTFWYISEKSKGSIDFGYSRILIGERGFFTWDIAGSHKTRLGRASQLSNLIVTGSMDEQTDQQTGEIFQPYSWRGHFHTRLFHASDLVFKNMTFKNAHKSDDHIFDLAGSHHISFEGLTFKGYGGEDLTSADIQARYKRSPHSLYSEAIQVDSAIETSFGGLDLSKTVLWKTDRYDQEPSSYITVRQSRFLPYHGPSGQQLIEGNITGRVKRPYGPTLGSHTHGNADYHHIRFVHNTFDHTVYAEGMDKRILYPIHMNKFSKSPTYLRDHHITIESNTFRHQGPYTASDSGVIDEDDWYGWYR